MDEDVKSKGAALQIGLYVFLALIMTPLAIGGLASYPDVAWYFGLALAFAATCLYYSAFALWRETRLKRKENQMRQLNMEVEAFARRKSFGEIAKSSVDTSQLNPVDMPANDSEQLLATWTYTPAEWRSFLKIESRIVIGESVLLVLLITGFGAWIIHDDADESWTFAIIFGFCFSIPFVLLRNFLKKSFITVRPGDGVTALINRQSIVLNGKLFNLTDGDRYLSKVELIEKSGRSMIEFTYKWQTRKGETQDELRLPVPEGKTEEARELVTKF